jgi:hypothetical protein
MDGSERDEGPGGGRDEDDPRRRRVHEWVRANFTEIFGVSVEDLRDRGVDPREYAQQHQDEIRAYARSHRSQRPAGLGGRFGVGYGWRGGFGIGSLLIVLLVVRLVLGAGTGRFGSGIVGVVVLVAALVALRFGRLYWLRRRRQKYRRGTPGSSV